MEKLKDFYKDKDHVVTFLNKFSKEFPEYGETGLTLIEKFNIYLEKYPDYDCWDRARYVHFKPKSTQDDIDHVVDLGVTYVSMRGKTCQMQGWRSGEIKDSYSLDSAGYYYVSVFSKNIRLHRLLCCTFLKRSEEISLLPYHKLQANHIDGIKTNYGLTNLEWVTPQGNVLHAVKTRLRPSQVFQMTLYREVKGYPVGTKFYLRNKDIKEVGFVDHPIYRAVRTDNKNRAYSAAWCVVDFDESFVFGFPTDLVKEDFITKPR